jgi:hypothetical protein
VPDVDDIRGATAAAIHFVGMAATIVGVPLVVARRLVRGRRALVVPAALTVATGLTIATQRTGWSLVKLWLGIDQPGRNSQLGRSTNPSVRIATRWESAERVPHTGRMSGEDRR